MDWKHRCNPLIILLWIFAIIVNTSSLARTLSAIEWNQKNIGFGQNGMYLEAEINDVIDIICPHTNDTDEDRYKAQYHTFIQVPYVSYESCNVTKANKTEKFLLKCNRPFDENKYTLLFQSWTPYPRGTRFVAGQSYYYITTANGSPDGIDQTEGGLCETHNMRLEVHIIDPSPPVPRVTTTQRPKDTTTSPLVHTTTRKSVERTKRPPPTVKPKPTDKIGNKNGYDKQTETGSACRYQMSSLLLLASCLIARVRWH
ncbi:ephrin-B2a-like [Antedon mediterranea]|uniref:ephrin-B2a-like n=1 Tax=Antedon mediterranea TaxID=105859 RepID=UPI003AF54871